MSSRSHRMLAAVGLALAAAAAPVSVRTTGGIPTLAETHACAEAAAAKLVGYCRPRIGYVCMSNGIVWLDHEEVWVEEGTPLPPLAD